MNNFLKSFLYILVFVFSSEALCQPPVSDPVCEYVVDPTNPERLLPCGTDFSTGSTSYSASPSGIFVNEMSTAIISGFLTGLLEGPSPAEIEQRRLAALEAQRIQLEEQRRIEAEKLRVQQNLFGQLVPLGGVMATMSNVGNENNGQSNLMNNLINFDGSSSNSGGSTLDSSFAGNAGNQSLDNMLVDLSSPSANEVPRIPDMQSPISSGNTLPSSLIVDPNFQQLETDLNRLRGIEQEYRAQKADIDDKLISGEISLEEWRQFQADHEQDMGNLENRIARTEAELQTLASQHGVDHSQLIAARAAADYEQRQEAGTPDSTQLAYVLPQTSSVPDLPEFSEQDMAQQQATVHLLDDPEYLQVRSNAYTLKELDEELDARLESANSQLAANQISQDEWEAFNGRYTNDKELYRSAIEANLQVMDSVYERHNLDKSEFVKEFYNTD